MLPDKSLAAQREAAEKERLAARCALRWARRTWRPVIKETKELKERQVRCSRVLKCCGFMHKVANACNPLSSWSGRKRGMQASVFCRHGKNLCNVLLFMPGNVLCNYIVPTCCFCRP